MSGSVRSRHEHKEIGLTGKVKNHRSNITSNSDIIIIQLFLFRCRIVASHALNLSGLRPQLTWPWTGRQVLCHLYPFASVNSTVTTLFQASLWLMLPGTEEQMFDAFVFFCVFSCGCGSSSLTRVPLHLLVSSLLCSHLVFVFGRSLLACRPCFLHLLLNTDVNKCRRSMFPEAMFQPYSQHNEMVSC